MKVMDLMTIGEVAKLNNIPLQTCDYTIELAS